MSDFQELATAAGTVKGETPSTITTQITSHNEAESVEHREYSATTNEGTLTLVESDSSSGPGSDTDTPKDPIWITVEDATESYNKARDDLLVKRNQLVQGGTEAELAAKTKATTDAIETLQKASRIWAAVLAADVRTRDAELGLSRRLMQAAIPTKDHTDPVESRRLFGGLQFESRFRADELLNWASCWSERYRTAQNEKDRQEARENAMGYLDTVPSAIDNFQGAWAAYKVTLPGSLSFSENHVAVHSKLIEQMRQTEESLRETLNSYTPNHSSQAAAQTAQGQEVPTTPSHERFEDPNLKPWRDGRNVYQLAACLEGYDRYTRAKNPAY